MVRRNKETHFTAELTPLIVYDGEIQVGRGYFLVRYDGKEVAPIIYDNEENLLTGEIYMIFPELEKRRLVVVATSIQ